ncbi:MAG TPA: hypothetical protein VHS31_09015 [Tepidisphaeraceae bacterium]|jgi:hypothetical protein|nr:hypothetical protein [Tepidisphaeraceae bacterium]
MMKLMFSRQLTLALGMLLLSTMTGCFGVELGTMKPGQMAWVQPNTTEPRAGHAYLIRGLIGLFSYGIDRMTDKVAATGVAANVFQEDQTALLGKTIVEKYKATNGNHEPIVLIGHSLGADDGIKISKMLEKEGIPVDLLITVDATNPPPVPGNVKVCYNYYQPSLFDGTGMLRGIPLVLEPGAKTKLYNLNIRGERKDLLEWDTNHVNIDKNTKIHAEVVAHVLEVCPTRQAWVAAHSGSNVSRAAIPEPPQTVRNVPVSSSAAGAGGM